MITRTLVAFCGLCQSTVFKTGDDENTITIVTKRVKFHMQLINKLLEHLAPAESKRKRRKPQILKLFKDVHALLMFEIDSIIRPNLRKVAQMKYATTAKDDVGAWKLKVPLRVDIGMGKNWAEAH